MDQSKERLLYFSGLSLASAILFVIAAFLTRDIEEVLVGNIVAIASTILFTVISYVLEKKCPGSLVVKVYPFLVFAIHVAFLIACTVIDWPRPFGSLSGKMFLGVVIASALCYLLSGIYALVGMRPIKAIFKNPSLPSLRFYGILLAVSVSCLLGFVFVRQETLSNGLYFNPKALYMALAYLFLALLGVLFSLIGGRAGKCGGIAVAILGIAYFFGVFVTMAYFDSHYFFSTLQGFALSLLSTAGLVCFLAYIGLLPGKKKA